MVSVITRTNPWFQCSIKGSPPRVTLRTWLSIPKDPPLAVKWNTSRVLVKRMTMEKEKNVGGKAPKIQCARMSKTKESTKMYLEMHQLITQYSLERSSVEEDCLTMLLSLTLKPSKIQKHAINSTQTNKNGQNANLARILGTVFQATCVQSTRFKPHHLVKKMNRNSKLELVHFIFHHLEKSTRFQTLHLSLCNRVWIVCNSRLFRVLKSINYLIIIKDARSLITLMVSLDNTMIGIKDWSIWQKTCTPFTTQMVC